MVSVFLTRAASLVPLKYTKRTFKKPHIHCKEFHFLLAKLLTTGQRRMTGDTDASLLPVHVHEPALQAAARRTEHLQNTMEKYYLNYIPTK